MNWQIQFCNLVNLTSSVVDPKLFVSDPYPDPTFQLIQDPYKDPTLFFPGRRIILNKAALKIYMKKLNAQLCIFIKLSRSLFVAEKFKQVSNVNSYFTYCIFIISSHIYACQIRIRQMIPGPDPKHCDQDQRIRIQNP